MKQMRFSSGLNLSHYDKLETLSLRNVTIDYAHNLRTPSSLQEFDLVGEFANIYPRPEEIKFPARNLTSISASGNQAIRFLGYVIRQGLDSEKLRKLRLKDFVTYSLVGDRGVWNNLNTLSILPRTDVFQKVEDLELSDDNLKDSDAATVLHLFPNVRNLELESEQITELFISEIVRALGRKLKSVTLRNCSSMSQQIVSWALTRGLSIQLRRTRTGTSRILGSQPLRHGTV